MFWLLYTCLYPESSLLRNLNKHQIPEAVVSHGWYFRNMIRYVKILFGTTVYIRSRFPTKLTVSNLCKIVFVLTGVFIQTEFATQPPLLMPSHSSISLHTLIGKNDRKKMQKLPRASTSRLE